MAVRSFEEQVRAEIGALRLKPNDQVWLHVEAALQKEKKRRWLVWLFAGLLAGGALGGYYYQQSVHQNSMTANARKWGPQEQPVVKQQAQINKEETAKANEIPQPSNDNTTPVSLPGKNGTTEMRRPSDKRARVIVDKPADQQAVTQQSPGGIVSRISSSQQTGIQTASPVEPAASANDQVAKSATGLTKHTDSIPVIPAITKTDSDQLTARKIADEKEQHKVLAIDSLQGTDPGNPVKESTTNKKKKKQWRFFGTVDIGSSKEVKPMVASSLAFASPPSNSIPSNNNGMYSNGAAYKEPSRSNGFSFGLGLQATRPIGKNTDIALGLGYQFYQTGITLGRQMSTGQLNFASAYNFYLSSDSTRYNNNWHFAEFSVDLYQRMSLGGSTVLRWRIGMGADLLLASNSLYYDKSAAILYEDEESRRKWQFNITTGFDLGIGKKQALFIGPQFTYFVTPSFHKDDYRFTRLGIRASVAIPKRKN
jgi:hypothetical protein